MPRFEPFPGIRYTPGTPLDRVTAPPYDVLSNDDRAALAAQHPSNVVVVDVPRRADGRPDYAGAAATFRRWRADGVLVTDASPTLTIYRLSFTDETGRRRTTSGVVGGLAVVEPGDGEVLPHERTTPKDASDRLELTRATEANLSPVWGLSLASGLSELLAEPGEAVGRFVDPAGVEHVAERVDDPARLSAITAAVGGAPVVIADGHHRYEVSRIHRRERSAGLGAGPWDLTMAFVVELVEDQLSVEAIHRLVGGLPVERSWADTLAGSFALERAGAVSASTLDEMRDRGALCLVEPDGQGTFLRPIADAFEGVEGLDSARLAHALREVPHDLRYQHGLELVLREVAAGTAQAGVLLRPVTVGDIQRYARAGALMPPKSTFFTPKLRTGIVFRSLEA